MDPNDVITSRENAKLKLARGARDGRESGFVFVEGVRLVEEALRSDVEIVYVFASADFDMSDRFSDFTNLYFVEPRIFRSLADTENPQGIMALVRRPSWSLADIVPGFVVLLHRINNPSNLGAVVRTAEAAGVTGLITTTGSADAFSPKALRASMGSAFRLPIVERIHFDDAMAWARKRGLVSTAADISGQVRYSDLDWTVPRLIVFGSEAHGLDDGELSLINEKILIPMENEVESLNLAVSSGIILFEAKRQRTG